MNDEEKNSVICVIKYIDISPIVSSNMGNVNSKDLNVQG